MIGIALTMPAASVAIFDDPAGLMYGPDGLLAFARRVGFSVASAATHNGALAGSPGAGQVDTLTASLITHTVREPLQLWNFGHVVDRVGGCGAGVVGGGAPRRPRRPDPGDDRLRRPRGRVASPSTSTAPTSGWGWCSWPPRRCWRCSWWSRAGRC